MNLIEKYWSQERSRTVSPFVDIVFTDFSSTSFFGPFHLSYPTLMHLPTLIYNKLQILNAKDGHLVSVYLKTLLFTSPSDISDLN